MIDRPSRRELLRSGGLVSLVSGKPATAGAAGRRGGILGGVAGLVCVPLWNASGPLLALGAAVAVGLVGSLVLGLHERRAGR